MSRTTTVAEFFIDAQTQTDENEETSNSINAEIPIKQTSDSVTTKKSTEETNTTPPKKRKHFVRWNAGSDCFAAFFVVLVGCALIIQFYRLPPVAEFKEASKPNESMVPLFTFPSIIGSAAGVVLFGTPYGTLIVAGICLGIAGLVRWQAPGLMEWWDKMAMLLGMLSLVVEFYYYVEKYERDD